MILRLQSTFAGDGGLVRDKAVITPHFQTTGPLTNADSLCQDLATALRTWCGITREVSVTAYDAQGTVPVYPIGHHTVDSGVSPVSDKPREVALCLSFFGGRNIPRQRGRIFVPVWAKNLGPVLVRPQSTHMDAAKALPAIFSGLGGVDVDWVVWSRAANTAYKVTNWWVDNEWDTVRSRGLRATLREAGTTSG